MKLLLDKIKLAIQKRSKLTQNKKSREAWIAKGYENAPEISVVIQSHNKSLQVKHIVSKLRAYAKLEIIVIDDGSDGTAHTQALTSFLTGANEFLIRSNDLYENVMYDKVIRFANGRYIALLQDDDDFDNDLAWIDEAVSYFRQYPKLAILGGKDGLSVAFEDDRKWAHGGAFEHNTPFAFVPAVNRAPMWINKNLFQTHLKHIAADFIPFQFDDYELCIRAWLCGLQVGWYDAHFRSLSVGGMRLWNNAFTQEQSERNGKLLYELYRNRKEELLQCVAEATVQA